MDSGANTGRRARHRGQAREHLTRKRRLETQIQELGCMLKQLKIEFQQLKKLSRSQDTGETTERQEEPQASEVTKPITNLHAKQDEPQQPQKDNSEASRELEAPRKAYDELVVENRQRKASTKNLGLQLESAKRQLKKQRAISREFRADGAEMNKESGVDACREEYDQLRARLASLEHTFSERDEIIRALNGTIRGLKMATI
ncbi:hypothetical protein LQW54_007729 [Pestalotiopsis sp. IQ-011]